MLCTMMTSFIVTILNSHLILLICLVCRLCYTLPTPGHILEGEYASHTRRDVPGLTLDDTRTPSLQFQDLVPPMQMKGHNAIIRHKEIISSTWPDVTTSASKLFPEFCELYTHIKCPALIAVRNLKPAPPLSLMINSLIRICKLF